MGVVFSFLGQAIAQLSENDPHSAGTGDWSQEIDACIPGNNNMVIDGLSFGTCKALCQAQMEFECRSVEYYSRTRRCQLSTATRTSPSFRQPCHINGWTFTEVARWSPPIDACIRGNNNEVIENISFDACKTRCQASPCRSIEYHSRDRRCSHSTVTSSSPSYRQPCHIPGWTFTELVVPVSCPEPLCNCNSNTIIVWEVTADGFEYHLHALHHYAFVDLAIMFSRLPTRMDAKFVDVFQKLGGLEGLMLASGATTI